MLYTGAAISPSLQITGAFIQLYPHILSHSFECWSDEITNLPFIAHPTPSLQTLKELERRLAANYPPSSGASSGTTSRALTQPAATSHGDRLALSWTLKSTRRFLSSTFASLNPVVTSSRRLCAVVSIMMFSILATCCSLGAKSVVREPVLFSRDSRAPSELKKMSGELCSWTSRKIRMRTATPTQCLGESVSHCPKGLRFPSLFCARQKRNRH